MQKISDSGVQNNSTIDKRKWLNFAHHCVHKWTGTVLYDFKSNGPSEITVFRGELLHILYRIGSKWLFCVGKNKQLGYVPFLYVHLENCSDGIATDINVPTLQDYLQKAAKSGCVVCPRKKNSTHAEEKLAAAADKQDLSSALLHNVERSSMTMTLKEDEYISRAISIREASFTDHKDSMPDLVNCLHKERDENTERSEHNERDEPITPSSMPLLSKPALNYLSLQRLSVAANSTSMYFETKLDSSSENSDADYSPENEAFFHFHSSTLASDSSGFGDESISSHRTSTASPNLSPRESDLQHNACKLKGALGNRRAVITKKQLARCERRVTFTDVEEVIGTACADVDRTSVPPTYAFQCDCDCISSLRTNPFNLEICDSISESQLYHTVVNSDPNSNVDRFTLV